MVYIECPFGPLGHSELDATFNIELTHTMLCLTLHKIHIVKYLFYLNQASSSHFSHPVMVQGPL
jgi:hypothetical protein